ncbi:hypothetical protein FRC02_006886 [Tulasnella sp. 418]|nr:hypothetical protein FRC02_006886 [Tulasnella sp. 418]
MAYADRNSRDLLAVAYGWLVKIYKKSPEGWIEAHRLAPEPTTDGYVVSVHFIDHPMWKLLISHARAGFSLWDHSLTSCERVMSQVIGNCAVSPDSRHAVAFVPDFGIEMYRLIPRAPFMEKSFDIKMEVGQTTVHLWRYLPLACLEDGTGFAFLNADGISMAIVNWHSRFVCRPRLCLTPEDGKLFPLSIKG